MTRKRIYARDNLAQERIEQGYTQLSFAEKAGVHVKWYNRVENRKKSIRTENALKIADGLGKSFEYLFEVKIEGSEKPVRVKDPKLSQIANLLSNSEADVTEISQLFNRYVEDLETAKGRLISGVKKYQKNDKDSIKN